MKRSIIVGGAEAVARVSRSFEGSRAGRRVAISQYYVIAGSDAAISDYYAHPEGEPKPRGERGRTPRGNLTL